MSCHPRDNLWKRQRVERSTSCMTGMCHDTSNKDLEPFFSFVVKDPQSITNINESLETLTVCIPVESPSLAALFPVLSRGLDHPVTRAHGCKEQRSGVTTQDRRAAPTRATNPRTGGRLTQRPARTGQAAVIF